MTLREVPLDQANGEQLVFKSIELAECIRQLDSIEVQKKEANDEWNVQIKAYRKKILKLAYEMKE